jgi:hypothetical protein
MFAVTLVAMAASLATAQERGGGRRGGFGFGGFGFGGPGALLAIPEVQKELGLAEADAKKLNDELRALWPQPGAGGAREEFRNLSEEEQQKRRDEFRKQAEEIGKKSDEKIKATLTEAQYKRLGELRIQREGAGSLSRAEVAEKLKLTDEQKEKIAKIQEEARPQFGRGRGGEGAQGERPNFEEIRARMEKTNADIVAVLSEEQKIAWEGMKGKKFDFPPPNFGGGRRGRGNRPAAE